MYLGWGQESFQRANTIEGKETGFPPSLGANISSNKLAAEVKAATVIK